MSWAMAMVHELRGVALRQLGRVKEAALEFELLLPQPQRDPARAPLARPA